MPSRTPAAPPQPAVLKTSKLRQVDVLVSQGQNIADAIRQIGVSEVACAMNCSMAKSSARLVHKAVIRCGIFSSQPATLAPDHLALHRWKYRCPTQARIADLNAVSTPNEKCYSPIVRMTLLSGRLLFDDSLSSCDSISSYFGTVVSSPFGTMCTTL
jgi:hypothetical protein